MAESVLVIPATISVGRNFPPYLPLPNGDLKPSAECTREEVAQSVEECTALAKASRERLQQAYEEHVRDIELLAQVSAYNDKYDQWDSIRQGGEPKVLLWSVPATTD
jgi:hypothetical protein